MLHTKLYYSKFLYNHPCGQSDYEIKIWNNVWSIVCTKKNKFACILPVVDTIVSLRFFQMHFDDFQLWYWDLRCSISSQIYLGARTNVSLNDI